MCTIFRSMLKTYSLFSGFMYKKLYREAYTCKSQNYGIIYGNPTYSST